MQSEPGGRSRTASGEASGKWMCVERVGPSPLAAERAVGQYGGMVAIDDIQDQISFVDWLNKSGLGQREVVALAVRSAMRAVPVV